MATVKLGRVRPVFKGDYDPTLSYEAMDCVRRNGNAYQAVREVPTGALPEAPDSIYWICIGMKGTDGQDGKDGADGVTGPQGEPGPQGIQGEQGPQGPAGADGAAGPQGPEGPQGPKGDTPSLYSGVDSAAKDVASTAYAVKTAYDKAVEATNAAALVGNTPATPDRLGMVRIGQGIDVSAEGVISVEIPEVSTATRDTAGTVQVGEGLEVTLPTEAAEGEEAPIPGILSLGAHASENPDAYGKGDFQFYGHVKLTDNFEEGMAAKDGVAISAKGVKDAFDRLVAAAIEVTLTTSGTWIVPESGTYTVTCVGGGGPGGNGGASKTYSDTNSGTYSGATGGGGGGGGAGQVITNDILLTKNESIACVVGGQSGATSFGTYIRAAGGGAGSHGGTASAGYGTASPGGGGLAGSSYGSVAGSGTAGNVASCGTINNRTISGGSGGGGGTTSKSPYGNGGAGGTGGALCQSGSCIVLGASGGGYGTQGAVFISLKLGG